MTASSPGAGGRPRRRPSWQAFGLSLLVLFAGFILLEAPPVAVLSGLVTEILAAVAVVPLKVMGFDIIRSGVELRDTLSGHAVAVTSACDGSGLIVGYLGLVALLGRRGDGLARRFSAFLVAVAVILAFNVVRIVLLFLAIGVAWLMLAGHLFAAPLLSSVLVAALAFQAFGMTPREISLWLAWALGAAIAWYFVGDAASCLASVPLANAMLFLLPFGVSETISCSSAEAQVITSGVQSLRPIAFVTAPLHPSDFTLALPLVAASLALCRRLPAAIKGALASFLLFSFAMYLGALTAGYDQASAARVAMLSSAGAMSNYLPPHPYWLAVLKAAQNMLVHFNLFVLPFALVYVAKTSGRQLPPQTTTATTRPTHRRRRK